LPEILKWLITGLMAYLSSTLSGVAGFGGAMIFLPFLIAFYGVRASVPILTVAVLLGNASRVYFNRRELDFKVFSRFSLGAIPLAIIGSCLYVSLPGVVIKKSIGVFLLFTVIFRHIKKDFKFTQSWAFVPVGMLNGFLSALVGGVGPLAAPFFLAYGLTKEAFVGTEALCATVMHIVKSFTYSRLAVLGQKEFWGGLSFGFIMVLGSYTAKKILEKIPPEKYLVLVEALLGIVGLVMLFQKG